LVPAIDLGSIDLEIAAEGNESDELKSGDESGRIPVSTTAPTDTARHTRHIGAINGTYETDPIPGTSGVTFVTLTTLRFMSNRTIKYNLRPMWYLRWTFLGSGR